jgi:type IV secretory pathway VirB4 component
MYIILNYIWNLIRGDIKKRVMVVDEAWWMMKYLDSALFLFGLVKRARKYMLGITTITQDVEDFLLSPYGRPIITNSSLQLLLKQSPAMMDIVAKTFNLTDGEKNFLLETVVGEGLFFAGLKHVIIQVVASVEEDKIIDKNFE